MQNRNIKIDADVNRFFEEYTDRLDALNRIVNELKEVIVGRPPIDFSIYINSAQSWAINYHERKHVYFWLPAAATLSFEDWGTGPLQAQVWINLGLPSGVRVFVPGSTSNVQVNVRCTDEVIA